MSKHKRTEDTVDRLEREVRSLKSTNRSLLRQLKKLSRGYKKFMVEDDHKEAHKMVEAVARKICFECSVGEMKEIVVCNRRWRACTHCAHRTNVSIIKEEK